MYIYCVDTMHTIDQILHGLGPLQIYICHNNGQANKWPGGAIPSLVPRLFFCLLWKKIWEWDYAMHIYACSHSPPACKVHGSVGDCRQKAN